MTYIYGSISPPQETNHDALKILKNDLQRYPSDGHVAISHGMVSGGVFFQRLRKPPFPAEEPIKDECSGITVFASARLDYRATLLSHLGLENSRLNSISDTQLILEAYLKWGERCCQYLEGDFSFFIWNPAKQYLWGARDPIGFKPLFFSIHNRTCFFSSHTTGLAILPGTDVGPDEGFLANRFLLRKTSLLVTPYRGVHQIPVGHSITINEANFEISKYYEWKTIPIREKTSNHDYASELTKLLTEAVETRLYTDYPVGGYLSGGLDSSAVLSIVHTQLDQIEKGRKLVTCSSVHAKKSNYQHEDERPWVETFAKFFPNTSINCCSLEDIPPLRHQDAEFFATERFRRYPTRFMAEMMDNKLINEGCRTFFTGWRGDHFISRRGYGNYTELLKLGHFRKFMRAVTDSARFTNRGVLSLLNVIWYYNFPKKQFDPKGFYGIEFLEKDWVQDLCSRTEYQYEQNSLMQLNDLNFEYTRILPDRQGTHQYYEDTTFGRNSVLTRLNPLSDPRIINFALKLPAQEFFVGGMDRSVLRRATKEYLPDQLRLRSTKGSFMDEESAFSAKVHEEWLNRENIIDIIDQSCLSPYVNKEEIKNYLTQHRKNLRQGNVNFDHKNTFFLNLLGIFFYFSSQN